MDDKNKKYLYANFKQCHQGIKEGNLFAKSRMAILLLNQNDYNNISEAYSLVIAVAKEDPLALHTTFKAARDKGDIGAHYGLFLIWEQGIGAPQNTKIASKYLIHAAQNGYTIAELTLGKRLGTSHYNHNQAPDYKKAKKYLTKAANKGLADAHTELYHILIEENNNRLCGQALNHLLTAITTSAGQYELSIIVDLYQNGKLVEKDISKVALWMNISYELGFRGKDELDEVMSHLNQNEKCTVKDKALGWLKENKYK